MITYWHPLCGTPKSYLLTICNVNRLTFHGANGGPGGIALGTGSVANRGNGGQEFGHG
jgi:hypothetical protein